MSKLKELITELCPDDVEYKTIAEICDISRGLVISKDYIRDNIGDYPVYSSQTENNGELGKISTYMFDGEYLTWTTDGANAGTVFYRNGKFSVTNVCGLLKVRATGLLPQFLYYTLSVEAPKYVNKGMGNPKLMSNVMSRIKVPIPPIEVQKEIVSVLDDFKNYLIVLDNELELREKQSNYYIAELLSFDNSTPKKKLDDCCILEKGKTPIQKAVAGEYPLVVTTEERKSSNTYQFNSKTVCIPLVSSRGHGVACLNRVYYQEGKFALGNILCGVTPNNYDELSAEYLYYYLNFKKDILLVPLMKGGANVSLTVDALRGVKVPVPTIEVQNDIVSKLKPFAEYQDYLRKEIEARQKQYEYYRDQLLSFKQLSE